MVSITAAIDAARRAQESMYTGVFTVIQRVKTTDDKTKLTSFQELMLLENQPCRLSFETITVATQGEGATSIKQTVKLFTAPEFIIPAGSKLIVAQDGVTTSYTHSGVPAVRATHQEIMLDLFDGWA